jgi:hypothetical protein
MWTYLDRIVRTVTVWGTLIAVAVGGAGLYAIRGRRRIEYGVAEIGMGPFTAAKVLIVDKVDVNAARWTDGLALLGAVYIVVRGLDNVGKALEGTEFEAAWRRFSG